MAENRLAWMRLSNLARSDMALSIRNTIQGIVISGMARELTSA